MQDRFKFRVWDIAKQKMFYPQRYTNFFNVNGTIVEVESYLIGNSAYRDKRISKEFDDAILMQCVGLKDKNGKLIYESDILKIDEISRLVVVRFKGISFELFAEPTNLVGYHNDKYIPEDCEIVGNIYENKELLNG